MKNCSQFIWLLVFLLTTAFSLLEATPSRLTERVCLGTDNGMSISGDSAIRYSRYKNRYSNCTYVDGNLELKFLEDQDYDLNFLKDIRIVTGYVLIAAIYARYIPLHSLQIIRGSKSFEWTDGSFCSLCVLINHKPNDSEIGLRELQMPALTEISNGNVVIYKNKFLCFIDTIAWTLIVPRTSQVAVVYHEAEKAKCYGCIHGCHKLRTDTISCWGLGIDMCQTQNNGSACSSSCAYRCFGPTSSQCCHSECAGGCTGPTSRDCYACRHMNDDGACVKSCPKIRNNRKRMRIHSNDQNKLTFQDICLRECPAYTSRLGDTCVLSCPEGTTSVKTDQYSTNTCQPCKKCPKECVFDEDFVHAGNIDLLKDCVIVKGRIAIVEATFKGDRYYNVPAMSPSRLDILMSIEEITNFLYISDTVPTITSLRMLRNLRIIDGQKTLNGYALAVVFCKGLQSLNLNSLRHIYQGNVMIRKNPNLCYANTMNMSHIFSTSAQKTHIIDNKDRIACLNTGQVCDYQCKLFGCWGPDAEDCIDCINYRVERTGKCVPSCWNVTMVYEGEQNTCKTCHEECSAGCSGPGANQCHSCLNVKFKNSCIKKCPRKMIRNSKGICKSKKRGSRKDRKRKLSPRKKKKRTSKKFNVYIKSILAPKHH